MPESQNETDLPDLEQLVELLVYAPIGLLYEYQTVLPQLIKRGKSQVQLAKVLGQFALKERSRQANTQSSQVVENAIGAAATLITEVGAAVGLAPQRASADPGSQRSSVNAESGTEPAESADRADSGDGASSSRTAVRLPIAGYDELKAKAIIELLDDLTESQLERVRQYESDNRGRKTVLAKIERLLG